MFSEIENGKQPVYEDRYTKYSGGMVNAITGVTVNNGVGFYTTREGKKVYEDRITIAKDGEYAGTTYLQTSEFIIAGHSVGLLDDLGVNNNALLYLASCLNKYKNVGHWRIGGVMGSVTMVRLKETELELPVLTTDSTEPYWDYMAYYIHNIQQQYAEQLEVKSEYELDLMCQILGVTRDDIVQRVEYTQPQNTNTFRVGDLFGVKSIKQVPSGFTPNFVDDGIPYLSQKTGGSYGVNGYLNPEDVGGELELITEGMIVTGVDNVANGVMYWWDEPFYANKMVGLTHKYLDKWTAQYIITLLLKQYSGYDYNNKISISVIKDTILELPVLAPNSKQIDWVAIRHVAVGGGQLSGYKSRDMQQRSCDNQTVDSVNLPQPLLKEFKLKDLFTSVKRGTRLVKSDRVPGNTPLITAGETNQGVSQYVQHNTKLFSANSLTIDMFGNVFYRGFEFFADDNIIVLNNPKLSKEVLLYIQSNLIWLTNNYSYAKQFRLTELNEITINLPVTNQDEPDWEFMEKYIARLVCSVYKRVYTYSSK